MHVTKNPKKEDDLSTNSVMCFCEVIFLHFLGSQEEDYVPHSSPCRSSSPRSSPAAPCIQIGGMEHNFNFGL